MVILFQESTGWAQGSATFRTNSKSTYLSTILRSSLYRSLNTFPGSMLKMATYRRMLCLAVGKMAEFHFTLGGALLKLMDSSCVPLERFTMENFTLPSEGKSIHVQSLRFSYVMQNLEFWDAAGIVVAMFIAQTCPLYLATAICRSFRRPNLLASASLQSESRNSFNFRT